MRKIMPRDTRSANDIENLLLDYLEEILPHDEIELFLQDNDISKFSVEMMRNDNDQLKITSVYISD